MFSINQRVKMGLFRLEDVYYAPGVIHNNQECDAVYYFHCQKPEGKAVIFNTMLIDLARDPEEILRSFRKSTRVAIEKVLANNKVHFDINDNPTNQELETFYAAYDIFATQKNILPANRELLNKIKVAGKLIIATALEEDKILCQFAMINADVKTVCYHGYNTRFNYLEDIDKVKLISQANRALDYLCMLHAKKAGKSYYDLCGLTMDPDDPSAENVDQYKMGFKGTVITEYHFMSPNNYKGRLFCTLKHLMGGIG